MKAAQWMGVPPWELLAEDLPSWWISLANVCRDAELEGEKAAQARAKARAKRR